MHFVIPDGQLYGNLHLQSSTPVDDSLFTVSCSQRIVKAVARDSLLVLADDAGQVTLVRLDSRVKGKGPAPPFSQLADGGDVLAMELCAAGDKQWVVISRKTEGMSVLEVYDAEKGRLYATLPSLHRTTPHSLVASTSALTLASVSSSEVLLFDFSADWSCTWALRGPSSTSITAFSPISKVMWIGTTADASSEPAALKDDLLTIWENGEICLWISSPSLRASHKPMKLVWRISPPSGLLSSSRPTATCSGHGFLYTTSTTGGKPDLFVWDIEERALVCQVPLELATVDSLHVLPSGDDDSTLLIHSEKSLYSLCLRLDPRRLSLRLLRHGIGAVVGVREGGLQLLLNGELCGMRISDLLKRRSPTTEGPTPSDNDGPRRTTPQRTSPIESSSTGNFDLSWLENVADTRLQRSEALKRYLDLSGSFPPAQRPRIYSTLLRCPDSSKYFTLLATPEDTATMNAFRTEWELADWRAQARMEGVIHLLRSHALLTSALVNSVPPCIYGLLVALPASTHPPTDQELFEICLTVLMRWVRVLWDETQREAQDDLWRLAEEVLASEGSSVRSLREKRVSISRILANVAHGLVNGVLEMADWVVVLDHIVARSPLFFVCLLGTLVDHHQEEVAALSASDTMSFFHHSHPVSTAKLIREAVRREQSLEGTELSNRVFQLSGFQEGLYLDANYRLVEK